ncbi:MAG: GDP-mannose 4,6-dehydratase [Erysipelotrichaceae bacterium]
MTYYIMSTFEGSYHIAARPFIFDLFEKEKFDIIVNFAAESHVDRSISDPEIFVRTNVVGTTTLLDTAKKFGVKRYHQVSTDEVYGDLPLDRPDLFFTEETPLPVYGKGNNVRDGLHVYDHCVAIDLIIRNGRVGEVYNIGGHNERTNLEVVQTILKALNKPESLIHYVSDRLGHDMRYAIDPTKLETELGWKPKYNFDTGIQQTITWYLENKEWWQNILSGEYSNYFEKMHGK